MAMTDVSRTVKVVFDGDGTPLQKTITTVEKAVNDAGNTAKKSGGVFATFGEDVKKGIAMGFGISTTEMVVSAINHLKQFAVDAVQTGMEFEQSMANVQAISGATGKEFETLTGFARELGATTMMSATESADAMSFLAMAGWDTQQIMAGLPAILDLTVASGREFSTVADIVSDNLTAFGLEAKDATMYSDALAYAMSNANVNMDTLGESLKYIAPVATTAGFSMQETVSAVMMLGDAGIKGSQAGTTLRTVMLNLTGANEKATAQLNDLGVAVYDSEGKTRKLTDIIRDLGKATEGMTDAQKVNVYNTIAGKTAVAGLSTLMEQGADKMAEYTTGVYTSAGATEEMAEIMGNTTEGKIAIFNSALDELKITMFEKVQPALQGGIEWLTDFITCMSGGQAPVEKQVAELTLFGTVLDESQKKLIATLQPFEQMQTAMENQILVTQNMGNISTQTMDELLTSTQSWAEQSVSLMQNKQAEEWALITEYSSKYLNADDQEKAKLKETFDSFYSDKINKVNAREEEISNIINSAKERNVSLTQEECDKIKSYNDATMKDLIKIASSSYEDQTSMLKAFKSQEVTITAENAQSIIDKATQTKDSVIKDAQSRLDKELASANALRKVGSISQEEYETMVADAQKSYNEIAKQAESGFSDVQKAIVENITSAGGKYNERTGELKNKHGELVATFKDNPPKTTLEATDNATSKINAVSRKLDNLNGRKATVTINTKENVTKRISTVGSVGRSLDVASSYMVNPVTKFTGASGVRASNNPVINYNGDFKFNNRNDIDYFMRQTARMIERTY